ncbi:MAG TPA: acyl-phosphate glycerol 3-phosphate acyltransferase [Chloroflexi bacterium]|jgi:glycerol-3-phosphate acyltransferase PlsY|nr:acyl-phosphate glycerol 3-phosphate acyltransferase [Chloroflexota bacterium]
MDASLLLVATVGAYLSGSIPFGLLVARLTGGPDPRSVGSGRTGGTNALRALGRRRAAVVSAGDILKGALPVLAVRALGGGDGTEVAAALFAVVGATRSIWVGFKGGRGIATGFGTALAIAPIALAAAAPIFIVVIWRTRIVSLGSLAAVAAFAPIEIFVRMQTPEGLSIWALAYSIAGPALVWLAHADNIARLRAGTERTFDAGALTRD